MGMRETRASLMLHVGYITDSQGYVYIIHTTRMFSINVSSTQPVKINLGQFFVHRFVQTADIKIKR